MQFRIVGTGAAAKSLQSCLTLCDPIDGSPSGSTIPGILQARTLEWVAIFFSNAWKWKVKVKLLSRVRLFASPWTAAYQAPLSMGFSRQECWSGVPLAQGLVGVKRLPVQPAVFPPSLSVGVPLPKQMEGPQFRVRLVVWWARVIIVPFPSSHLHLTQRVMFMVLIIKFCTYYFCLTSYFPPLFFIFIVKCFMYF